MDGVGEVTPASCEDGELIEGNAAQTLAVATVLHP
jgi:hypothetical protein